MGIRFSYCKNEDKFCMHCKNNFELKEPMLINFFSIEGSARAMVFHVDCYREWADNIVVTKYHDWVMSADAPKKRGRPRKAPVSTVEKDRWKPKRGRPCLYKDSHQARNLMSLMHYHRKRGNETKVAEIQSKLSRLHV